MPVEGSSKVLRIFAFGRENASMDVSQEYYFPDWLVLHICLHPCRKYYTQVPELSSEWFLF